MTLNLSIAFQNGSYYVNNATFKSPSVPVLLQILSGSTNAHDLLPSGSVYTLPLNKTIEIVIPGGGNVRTLISSISSSSNEDFTCLASLPSSWSCI